MKRILSVICLFFIIISSSFLFVTLNNQRNNLKSKRNNMIVDLNEIEQLAKLTAEDKSNENKLEESISTMQDEIRSMKDTSSIDISSIVRIYVTFIAFILCLLIYVYYEILHPFKKLKDFAASIAKGDFDSPLYVERNNMFGEFTWSFDMMRNEVKKARRYEKEAVENNKIAIATISHDIKTPIASIRAYTEALQSNMDTSYERKQRYLSVILKKCDEVTELTNDLFLHFLSDLQKLEINCEKLDAKNTINDIINSLLSDKNKVVIHNEIPECIIYCDSKRIGQVFDNIIANSLKYGDDGTIDFYFKITKEGKYLECTIKDHGPGISDEDMPFIFNKFYRGHNTNNKSGAGLGLYIVKYIMEQINGSVKISNYEEGLKAVINLPIININSIS